jgi:Bifunctional DNA primase/polymerase, N-terminal/CHC2 zinc finger
VLPLVPHEKRPITTNGLLDASTDFPVILDWWTRWPSANIGLRTGVQFDVLDIDGEVGRTSLEAKAGPETAHSGPVSRTGRGEHWLFLPSGTANRAGLLDKLDWRGTNGYIVAPPSVHPDGHLYAWDPERGPDMPLPEVPEWLAPLLSPYVERKAYAKVRANPNSVGIVDIAEAMGLEPRRSGGGRYVVRCVFHDDMETPNLTLYPDDNSFYCFGCGAWGDMFNLHSRTPGVRRA